MILIWVSLPEEFLPCKGKLLLSFQKKKIENYKSFPHVPPLKVTWHAFLELPVYWGRHILNKEMKNKYKMATE